MSECEWSALLERAGIRVTKQRIAVARAVLHELQHVSADQVLAMVNDEQYQPLPSISRATVYNTLNLFVEKNLLKRVVIDADKILYDSNTTHHYHFYNEDTGELTDFQSNEANEVIAKLPKNAVKTDVNLIIRVR